MTRESNLKDLINSLASTTYDPVEERELQLMHYLRWAGNAGAHVDEFERWYYGEKRYGVVKRIAQARYALYACSNLGYEDTPQSVKQLMEGVAPSIFEQVKAMAREEGRLEGATLASRGSISPPIAGIDEFRDSGSEDGEDDKSSSVLTSPVWREGAKEKALSALVTKLGAPERIDACAKLLDALPAVLAAFNAQAMQGTTGSEAGTDSAARGAGMALPASENCAAAIEDLLSALEGYSAVTGSAGGEKGSSDPR